jgi:hypothetical protein
MHCADWHDFSSYESCYSDDEHFRLIFIIIILILILIIIILLFIIIILIILILFTIIIFVSSDHHFDSFTTLCSSRNIIKPAINLFHFHGKCGVLSTLSAHTHIHTHIHTHTYIHTYTHTHIHTYTQDKSSEGLSRFIQSFIVTNDAIEAEKLKSQASISPQTSNGSEGAP